MGFTINESVCIECGICRELCPPRAIRHQRHRTIHRYEIVQERCIECDDAPCLAFCPVEGAVETPFTPERERELQKFPPQHPDWPGSTLAEACTTRGAAAAEAVVSDPFLTAAERGELEDKHYLAAIEALWEMKRWSYTIYGSWVNHTPPRRYMELEYWTSRILFEEWCEIARYTELLIQGGAAHHKRDLIRKEYEKLPEFLGAVGRFVDWQEINAHFEPPVRFASLAGIRQLETRWKERLGQVAPGSLGPVFASQLPALRAHRYMAMIAIGRYHDGTSVMAKEIDWAFDQGIEWFSKALTEIGQRGLDGQLRVQANA